MDRPKKYRYFDSVRISLKNIGKIEIISILVFSMNFWIILRFLKGYINPVASKTIRIASTDKIF